MKQADAKPGETPPRRGDAPAAAAPPAGMPALPPGMNFGPPGAPAGIPSCIPSPIMLSGGIAPPPPQIREINVIPAVELPDYRPPFTQGATRAEPTAISGFARFRRSPFQVVRSTTW